MSRLRRSVPVGVLLGLLLAPASADAHAVLEGTQPGRGAALTRPPDLVTMRFNEPVEASFGAVRVYDRDGARVDSGELVRPDGRSDSVGTGLEGGLGDGIYTATYRVISADSHPVSGGFTFTVGEPGAQPALGVGELIESGRTGPVTDAALGAARFGTHAATALIVGGLAFLVLVWGPALAAVAGGGDGWLQAAERFGRRLRRLLAVALGAGAAATAVGITLQGAVGLGAPVWEALRPGVIEDVLATRFGTAWGVRLADLAALAVLLLVPAAGLRYRALALATLGAGGTVAADPLPRRPVTVVALGLALGVLALIPAISGHAGVTDPAWLNVGANFAHVLAFATWAGGLVVLVACVPAATRELEPGGKSALLAGVVTRFSTLAIAAVAVLLATGIVQSLTQLDAWSDLLDSGYGRAILIKAGLLAALVGLGAYNRQRLRPRLAAIAQRGTSPGATGLALRRTVGGEVALIGGVLAATAALAALAPPGSTDTGPFSTSAELGQARVELTVDPAVAGPNEVHIYLFDPVTGAQYDRGRRLRVRAELPAAGVGPLTERVRRAGPGHYVVPRATLGIAGDWELELALRISAFEEHRATVEVPVR